ncbi:MAG: metallophosphoesterase family protein [Deltaproteobacteria bacterium]|nr:metallophosphoesterase family protein [Deltaproteobacteria bacterium]
MKIFIKWLKKTGVFVLASLSFLSGCDEDKPKDNILITYSYFDGPWITLNSAGNDGCSITINYTTPEDLTGKVFWGITEGLENTSSDTVISRVHHVILNDLIPGQKYFYAVDGDPSGETYSFTAPFSGLESNSIRFAVVGDIQPENQDMIDNALMVSDTIVGEQIDFWVQLGDLVYRGSSEPLFHNSLQVLRNSSSSIPMTAVMGNHDKQYDAGRNWSNAMPFSFNETGLQQQCYYYSNSIGGVLMIYLDSNCLSDSSGERQLLWLDELLQNRTELWTFVFLHDSIISSGMENIPWENTSRLLPVFDRYAVDAVFYGHDHMYEHYFYQYGENGYLFSDDHNWEHNRVHYFLSGGGGANLESEYGITGRFPFSTSRVHYNTVSNDWETLTFGTTSWNASRYISWADDSFSPGSHLYYHDPDIEIYQQESVFFGLDYGENTLHYIIVDVNGNSCTITVMYPDSQVLSGPEKLKPQSFTISK